MNYKEFLLRTAQLIDESSDRCILLCPLDNKLQCLLNRGLTQSPHLKSEMEIAEILVKEGATQEHRRRLLKQQTDYRYIRDAYSLNGWRLSTFLKQAYYHYNPDAPRMTDNEVRSFLLRQWAEEVDE